MHTIHIHTHTNAFTRKQQKTFIRKQTHSHVNTHIPTQTHFYTNTFLHKHIPTQIHSYTNKHIPTQTSCQAHSNKPHSYTNKHIVTNPHYHASFYFSVPSDISGKRSSGLRATSLPLTNAPTASRPSILSSSRCVTSCSSLPMSSRNSSKSRTSPLDPDAGR